MLHLQTHPMPPCQASSAASESASRSAPQAHTASPALDSGHLLQGQREVLIRHGGECYRLRHTRNDKLILTK